MSEVRCNCPTCGQTLPAGLFAVDIESRIIIAGNKFAALTAQEMEIFSELYRKPGAVKSRERLLACIAPIAGEEQQIKIVDIFILKLRKKLTPLSVSIQTVRGSGYRLMPRAPDATKIPAHNGGVA
ncbi:winged helix-turn-helix domain-containing protein [Agrobacterium pusense]|uniref:winged helix-turn-helix domain-containing protein n=1 Tax=Agrobacterium pusense TaxID=648995 RepID=UPI002FDE8B0D